MINKKRFVLAALVSFVFIFIYEFIVHGNLMLGLYEQTAEVWRPQEEADLLVMFISQVLFAVALAFFYPIVGLDDASCKKALPFGIGLGLVMAMPQIATYTYLPIPISISLLWALITFVKVLGASYIVSKIYNWKK